MTQQKSFYLISPNEGGAADRFAFTYSANGELSDGQLVRVSLGNRPSLGVVLSAAEQPAFETKPVSETLDLRPLPRHLVELGQWLADYYLASPKAVWQTMLPRGLTVKRRAQQAPPAEHRAEALTAELTADQTAAIDTILSQPGNFLLHGVTGSGKTQVYIELARRTLSGGRSAIIIVPEIALTPQTVARFRAEFDDRVIVTHSQLPEAQRHQAWLAALNSDEPRVVVGPRSALFLPLAKPGLVVIDECHETSYKQEQAPRYTADAAAAKLASLTGAKLVLGSATPSLAQKFLVQHGRLSLVEMKTRANSLAPAPADIIDLRQRELLRRSRFLSEPLLEAISQTLASRRQTLLFINRRGSASSQVCGDCGRVSLCPNCRLPLTFHADLMRLVCHACNFRQAPPAVCPECGQANLRLIGGGTKRVEAEISSLFPKARVARLDKDSATGDYIDTIMTGLAAGDIDIIIGTQMIAKGLDLPAVDTVGVVLADTMLYLPDYTASERTFQLLAQVSGRGGRGDRPGRTLIQTYTPDHPAIVLAAQADYDAFAAAELAQRRLLAYPPYVFLLKLTASASSAAAAQAKAQALFEKLKPLPGLSLLGPAPAFRETVGRRWHWQIIVKTRSRSTLLEAARLAPKDFTVDPDPINLL